jgi:hypothetical protein
MENLMARKLYYILLKIMETDSKGNYTHTYRNINATKKRLKQFN